MAAQLNDGPRPRISPDRWVDALGATSAIAYAWLAHASHAPPVPLAPYFIVLGLAWMALLVLHGRFAAEGDSLPLGRVIVWCIGFRVIGLFAAPILEDDFYRYLWDGRSSALLGNPYLTAPMSHFDDPSVSAIFQRILDGINNPDVPTLYPPMCQLLFVLGYWLAPGELLPIKLGLVLADLATLALLIRMIPRGGVLLYAWCPLLIQETAFSAHPDSLGIFFIIAAFFAMSRRRPALAASCAALAIGSKGFALLLLPFLMRHSKPRHGLLFCGWLALLYAPFLLPGMANESTGLSTFLAEWEFNSTLFALLAGLWGSSIAKAIGLAAVASVCAALLWRSRFTGEGASAALPRGDILFGCFFLISPVVNPWYLLWMLPFVAARPSAWGLAALAGVSLSYVHGLFIAGLAPYQHPWWIRPCELLIVAIGLSISLWNDSSGSSRRSAIRKVRVRNRLGGSTVSHRSLLGVALVAALVAAIGIGSSGIASASGSYRGQPAHPPASIDRAKYELGKKVFAGQFPRGEHAGDTASQAELLQELQLKLPLKARSGVSLPNYAGQLEAEQMAALQYFLKKRYKVE